MVLVAEQELNRVRSKREIYDSFCLPGAEVQMIEVVRYGVVQRWQLGIDQKMVVTGIGLFDARGRHAHVDQTEANGRLLRNDRSVLQADEIHARARR